MYCSQLHPFCCTWQDFHCCCCSWMGYIVWRSAIFPPQFMSCEHLDRVHILALFSRSLVVHALINVHSSHKPKENMFSFEALKTVELRAKVATPFVGLILYCWRFFSSEFSQKFCCCLLVFVSGLLLWCSTLMWMLHGESQMSYNWDKGHKKAELQQALHLLVPLAHLMGPERQERIAEGGLCSLSPFAVSVVGLIWLDAASPQSIYYPQK